METRSLPLPEESGHVATASPLVSPEIASASNQMLAGACADAVSAVPSTTIAITMKVAKDFILNSIRSSCSLRDLESAD